MITSVSLWMMYLDDWIMRFLQKRLKWRDIRKNGSLYIRRFNLIHAKHGRWKWKWLTKYGVAVFIHYFARGDEDRHKHDHPWSWIALLLTGWYREEDDAGFRLVLPFIPRFRRATYRHRVHLKRPIWTIFIHFKRRREWGFHTEDGWVHHDVYNGPTDDPDAD